MDWSHISAQSALYELWLHLFPLTWPWEFNFLVSPQAPFFYLRHPTLNSFRWAFVLASSSPPTFTHQTTENTSFAFPFSLTVLTVPHKLHLRPQKVSELLSRSRRGHLPPILFAAVHLLAVVSMDVEWRPNPLKAHVGTVCISFSHLEERPQPSPFTGIPCPLSAQPQPKALA